MPNEWFTREPEGTIAHETKTLPQEEVDDALKAFNFKTTPLEHQKRALVVGLLEPRWLYALDMGTGKTKIAIDLFNMHHQEYGIKKVLVICPPIVRRHWVREVEKHSNFTASIVDGGPKEKIEHLLNPCTNFTAISYAWIAQQTLKANRYPEYKKKLQRLYKLYDMVVLDEAHCAKNPSSRGFRFLRQYLYRCPFFYLLTGTPIGNSPADIWTLYDLMASGVVFDKSFKKFQIAHFNIPPHPQMTPRFKTHLLEPFREKVWSKAIRWQEAECLNLPPVARMQLDVELTDSQRKLLKEVQAEALEKLSDGKTQASQVLSSCLPEAMRITAGLKTNTSPKIEALKSYLHDVVKVKGEQAIVWAWLQDEFVLLHDKLKKDYNVRVVNGKTSPKQLYETLDDWSNNRVEVLLANPASIGVGVNLYESRTAIYFSNSYSLINRTQSEKRIHRIGQNRTCNYVDIVSVNSVDERILDRIESYREQSASLTLDREWNAGVTTESVKELFR